MHSPEGNPIPPEAMGTMQLFHPMLLKMLRKMNLGVPEPSAASPIAGRFAGSASSSHA